MCGAHFRDETGIESRDVDLVGRASDCVDVVREQRLEIVDRLADPFVGHGEARDERWAWVHRGEPLGEPSRDLGDRSPAVFLRTEGAKHGFPLRRRGLREIEGRACRSVRDREPRFPHEPYERRVTFDRLVHGRDEAYASGGRFVDRSLGHQAIERRGVESRWTADHARDVRDPSVILTRKRGNHVKMRLLEARRDLWNVLEPRLVEIDRRDHRVGVIRPHPRMARGADPRDVVAHTAERTRRAHFAKRLVLVGQ